MNSELHGSDMEPFLEQIQSATEQMGRLSCSLSNLTVTKEQFKSVTSASSRKAIRKRMEKSVSEVGKSGGAIKMKLEAIKKDNLDSREKPGCEEGSATDRIRTNMTHCSMKRFKGLMTQFQIMRLAMEAEYGEVVERRAVTGSSGTETYEEVMNNVEGFEERHDILTEVEKELLELHQIYLDMAVLVEAQDWMLDHIESQVNRTGDYVHGVVDVTRRLESGAKNSRKGVVAKVWSSFSEPFHCFRFSHNQQ